MGCWGINKDQTQRQMYRKYKCVCSDGATLTIPPTHSLNIFILVQNRGKSQRVTIQKPEALFRREVSNCKYQAEEKKNLKLLGFFFFFFHAGHSLILSSEERITHPHEPSPYLEGFDNFSRFCISLWIKGMKE